MKPIKAPAGGQAAFLIAAGLSLSSKELQENLEELSALAEAAGFQPKTRFSQNLKTFDPAFLIGSGKRETIRRAAEEQKPDIFILTSTDLSKNSRFLTRRVRQRSGFFDRFRAFGRLFAAFLGILSQKPAFSPPIRAFSGRFVVLKRPFGLDRLFFLL